MGGVSVDHMRISPGSLASGTFLVGTPDVNQINSVSDHGDIYASTPDAFVINTLSAVSPVRVPPTTLSLVVESVLIFEVFVAISADSASNAVFIDPDIDPRVNI